MDTFACLIVQLHKCKLNINFAKKPLKAED